MTNESEKRPIEIVTDEDWKTRVKAEDAKLDAESTQPDPEPESGSAAPPLEGKLPPASFPMLVQMFSTQAIMSLGLIPGPSGENLKQLPMARHFIDLLSVLEEKTKGNLSDGEAKFLEQTLHELRMAYVEVSRQK